MILVPSTKPGVHSAFVETLIAFHLCFMLLEPSLELIKLPQIYMSSVFLIFLLLSLQLTTTYAWDRSASCIIRFSVEWIHSQPNERTKSETGVSMLYLTSLMLMSDFKLIERIGFFEYVQRHFCNQRTCNHGWTLVKHIGDTNYVFGRENRIPEKLGLFCVKYVWVSVSKLQNDVSQSRWCVRAEKFHEIFCS